MSLRTICLEEIPASVARSGRPRATYYSRVKAGLLPPLVRVGRRSLVPSHELDAVLAAESAGQSDDEIRELVKRLFGGRKALAARLAALEPIADLSAEQAPPAGKRVGAKQQSHRA